MHPKGFHSEQPLRRPDECTVALRAGPYRLPTGEVGADVGDQCRPEPESGAGHRRVGRIPPGGHRGCPGGCPNT